MPRLRKGDPGYENSSHAKSIAKNNAKTNAKTIAKAATRSEASRQARGETITFSSFLDECERDALLCFNTVIMPQLQAGRGIDIMCMADHRLRPVRSSPVAADGTTYEEHILLSGVPYGGVTNDEAARWACQDPSPAIMSGVTMDALSHPEFMQHFEVRLLRSHAYHEYTRLFEGELIRLCMRTSHGDIDLRPFWPLLFNRQAGLDGSHDWGQTHVCIAFTKRPLHVLVAAGELFRAKPPWAGLTSGLCQRTLCEKLRAGQAELADGELASHPLMLIASQIDCAETQFGPEACVRAERLVCVGTHKRRANANCFYVVQQWATGGCQFGITITHGRISCRGRTLVRAVDLLATQATAVFEMIVQQEVGRGYTQAGAP